MKSTCLISTINGSKSLFSFRVNIS